MVPLLVALGVLLVFAFIVIGLYNGLQRKLGWTPAQLVGHANEWAATMAMRCFMV